MLPFFIRSEQFHHPRDDETSVRAFRNLSLGFTEIDQYFLNILLVNRPSNERCKTSTTRYQPKSHQLHVHFWHAVTWTSATVFDWPHRENLQNDVFEIYWRDRLFFVWGGGGVGANAKTYFCEALAEERKSCSAKWSTHIFWKLRKENSCKAFSHPQILMQKKNCRNLPLFKHLMVRPRRSIDYPKRPLPRV